MSEVIFSHPNPMIVANAENVLAAAGIECELRNSFAIGASGGLACQDVWPQLLVADSDIEKAQCLLKKIAHHDGDDWQCSACGEDNAPAFELCWHCGATLPHN
ncbi:protein of unknown function (DUF2007) [Spongiibacter sp. IMCC21906]|jgi:hypothetical protein|uniref:putative signal transducing protein n=1 Tax=Spongiibacter sp. IMCC21906 TaxID=1620392 RepID=UPI00062DEA0D|nr:DUF2007 domain-containing protein [Spongiibacter sp. IMCC21906]AKH68290.1 protein of unknown function (DUF2007) [Spongiibacter sp. IMCC21906]